MEGNQPYVISSDDTKDVITMRKLELLLDVLVAPDSSNASDVYGIKLNVVDKIDRLINQL